jgi:hypothetical protein
MPFCQESALAFERAIATKEALLAGMLLGPVLFPLIAKF